MCRKKLSIEKEIIIILIQLICCCKASNNNETSNTELNSTHLQTKVKNDDEHLKFFETLREITGIYLFPLIGIFGIIGNIFIVIVYSRSQKYSTNVYLIALSCSDIFKLANDLTYFLVTFVTKFNPILGEKMFFILYKYSHYLFVVTSFNTSWLTCAISLDRYFAVVRHNAKKIKSNYLQSFLISIIISFVSIVAAIPAPLFNETIKHYDPLTNHTIEKISLTNLGKSDFKKYYQFLSGVFRAVLPLLILIILNVKIVKQLFKTKMQNVNKQRNRRVTMMLVTIVITFVICIFPDAIMTMMQLGYADENSLIRGIREITDVLLEINSASTFPICFHFSLQFRSTFKSLFPYFFTFEADEIIENQDYQPKRLRASRKSRKNFDGSNENIKLVEIK